MDGGAWWAAVPEVVKSQTQLSDFTFTFHFHALEKEVATHSSVLAWRIPGTEEPGGLQSTEVQRVRHDRAHIYKMKNHRPKPLVLFPEQDLINILFCSSWHLLNISVLQLVWIRGGVIMVFDGLVSCTRWRMKSTFLGCHHSYFTEVAPGVWIYIRLTCAKTYS